MSMSRVEVLEGYSETGMVPPAQVEGRLFNVCGPTRIEHRA